MARDEWPQTWPQMRPEMRLSDLDRDRAVVRLSEHYAADRLDKDEFDERSDAVWTARTAGDLEPLFADLGPLPLERPHRGRAAPRVRRGRYRPRFLPVLLLLVALTVVTHVPFVLLALLACVFVATRRRHHW